jgi:hypothetical protein
VRVAAAAAAVVVVAVVVVMREKAHFAVLSIDEAILNFQCTGNTMQASTNRASVA